MVMPWEYGAQEFTRWTGKPMAAEDYATAVYGYPPATLAIANSYNTWLANYLDYLVAKGDINEDTADKLYASAQNALSAKQGAESWPLIDVFLETYRNIYPAQEAGMSDDEIAYLESQTAYNLARVQEILNSIGQMGQVSPDTQAELDYLMQRLEFDMRQANIGNQLDWANFELSKNQLELQRNEWLAQLQANPATFYERWYAEHLPGGGGKLPLASDQALSSWATKPLSGTWALNNAPRINNAGTLRPASATPGPGVM